MQFGGLSSTHTRNDAPAMIGLRVAVPIIFPLCIYLFVSLFYTASQEEEERYIGTQLQSTLR
jgi:hypothetical protein